jgi:hypothetical protein
MNQIEKYKGITAELAVAESFEEIKLIESKAAAVAEFGKKNKICKEEQDEWGTIRVQIETKKGKWLEERFPKGNLKGTNIGDVKSRDTTLHGEGITPDESANARLVYNEPDLVKESIEEIKGSKEVVTPRKVASKVRNKKIDRK